MNLSSSALDIACQMMRYPSVTPQDYGLLEDLSQALRAHGFEGPPVIRWQETTNLYLRYGKKTPHLCFAGHIDVVPPGPESLWTFPPFKPTIHQGRLYGRGAVDMKGAVACFLRAVLNQIKDPLFQGSCSILLTSDEEGCGHDGIKRMVPWLQQQGEIIDHILIGEPTGSKVGAALQIGRRGSLTSHLTCFGRQGHIAYPDLCDNPIPRLMACLRALESQPLDEGTPDFEPSRLTITAIETGNIASNVVPSQAEAFFGVRFNPFQTADKLQDMIHHVCQTYGQPYHLACSPNGDSFLTQDPFWIQLAGEAMKKVTGITPSLTTRGGTTDGRFLHVLAPVLEIGLPEDTMHQVDEQVAVAELDLLTQVYESLLGAYLHRCG